MARRSRRLNSWEALRGLAQRRAGSGRVWGSVRVPSVSFLAHGRVFSHAPGRRPSLPRGASLTANPFLAKPRRRKNEGKAEISCASRRPYSFMPLCSCKRHTDGKGKHRISPFLIVYVPRSCRRYPVRDVVPLPTHRGALARAWSFDRTFS